MFLDVRNWTSTILCIDYIVLPFQIFNCIIWTPDYLPPFLALCLLWIISIDSLHKIELNTFNDMKITLNKDLPIFTWTYQIAAIWNTIQLLSLFFWLIPLFHFFPLGWGTIINPVATSMITNPIHSHHF